MKTNQSDPEVDGDGIEPARLATFGVLVGLLIVACIVLVVTLSSGGTPPAPQVRQEPRTAVETPPDPATAAQQRASAVPTVDPLKTPAKPEPGRRRANSPSTSKTAKPNKPYVISVTPGRTPRMTQVQ
jgi:hypothetical protein